MQYKKILVTGAAGFIGYHTVKSLVSQGHEVVGLDNMNDYYSVQLKQDRLSDLGIEWVEGSEEGIMNQSKIHSSFRFVKMNVEDRHLLPLLFKQEKFDAVIHLAAQAGVRYSLENPAAYIDSNIVGFLNVLESCRHHSITHLVYASSSSVYGANAKIPFSEQDRVDEPLSLYAATKKSNELMAYTYSHLYQIPTSGLRFFTVYGPWGRPDMAPMLFAEAITKGQPIKVFNHGNMSRDFTYIDDIVNGIIITLNHPPLQQTPPYQLLNIGNGAPVSLLEFIETLEQALGQKAEKVMMDMQPGDVPQTWADTNRLQQLGYKSETNIQQGVGEFIEWFNLKCNLKSNPNN